MSALARVLGPAAGGLLYQFLGLRAPYLAGAAGMVIAWALTARLPPLK
jgi:predicted MFS family arabinose efflux permease